MIHDCPRRNQKAEDSNRSKIGNMNGTYNTSNMYTDITRADITSIHTSQTNDNSITIQVQMPHMVRQIRFNTVATNNDVSVT